MLSVALFGLPHGLRLRSTALARRGAFPMPTTVPVSLVTRCLRVCFCCSPLAAWAPWHWVLGSHSAGHRCGTHRAWVKGSGPLRRRRQTMFGPCLLPWMQSATQCKRGVLSSCGTVGLPVLARRWSVESVLICTLYLLLPSHFYFRYNVLLL